MIGAPQKRKDTIDKVQLVTFRCHWQVSIGAIGL